MEIAYLHEVPTNLRPCSFHYFEFYYICVKQFQMYKVFYYEKPLTLSEKPVTEAKNLKFLSESQFNEALALLKNEDATHVNIYHYNLENLWKKFVNHFNYLEAAGGLVKNNKNEILFIYRLDKWDLPKGKVEPGETTELAAVREVEEECGISHLKIIKFITNTYHIYYDSKLRLKSTYWYEMYYDGNEELIPQIEEGIGIAEWKSQTEFPEVLNHTYENVKILLQSEIDL